ncbi:zf-HC2 domain-containing protein [Kitasatospora kazusensis]|uniref:Zf-HC2 domain-containing protein n=1 Tax=Kitasatospora kazusensis TaxID=407974 RepID=A0ABP5M2F8_9ACTN
MTSPQNPQTPQTPQTPQNPQSPRTPHEPPTPGTPRTPEELHLDVGAYLLGVLDPAERLEFEEHLADCATCTAEAGRLGGLEPILAELAAAGLPPGESRATPEPSGQLLDRLVGEVAATRRRSRTRRLVLAAAAAVLIVGGPVATATLNGASAPQAVAAAQQFSATDPATGTSATVGVTARTWGSQINLSLSLGTVQGPLSCDLVAVSRTGERQTVTTWSVPPAAYTTLRTTGGAGLPPGAIDHFELRTLDTANRLLLSVPAAPGPAS